MSITAERRTTLIGEYATAPSDTGSPEVQVALLSARIDHLTDHFKAHKQDHHSRRGLLKLVNQRKRLLSYLKDRDLARYQSLIERLGLRLTVEACEGREPPARSEARVELVGGDRRDEAAPGPKDACGFREDGLDKGGDARQQASSPPTHPHRERCSAAASAARKSPSADGKQTLRTQPWTCPKRTISRVADPNGLKRPPIATIGCETSCARAARNSRRGRRSRPRRRRCVAQNRLAMAVLTYAYSLAKLAAGHGKRPHFAAIASPRRVANGGYFT